MPHPIVLTSGNSPVVQANFAQNLNDFTTTSQTSGYPTDWTTLASTSTMPTGGSISRTGVNAINAMLYDSTGKLTYAPNNIVTYSQALNNAQWNNASTSTSATVNSITFGATQFDRWITTSVQAFSGNIIISAQFSAADVGKQLRFSLWSSNYDGLTNGQGLSTNLTVPSNGIVFFKYSGVIGLLAVGFTNSTAGSAQTLTLASGAGIQVEACTYETAPRAFNSTSANFYYGPRFDYDPVTLQNKGLLVEGTRTNLLVYSQSFASGWSQTNTAITVPNNIVSPDGTTNGGLFSPSATVNNLAAQALTTSATTTFSIYAKSNGANWITLRLFDGTTTYFTWFNLSSGAIGTNQNTSASITPVGNSWYRLSITRAGLVAGGSGNVLISASDTDGAQSVASTSNRLYVWGAQAEAASFSSSYIPTIATATARAAETFLLTGYANRLVEAYYIDEQTGANFSGNSTVVASGDTTINPPTFGWVTSLRAYTNAYATSPTAATNVAVTRTGGTAGQVPMLYDSTGTLTYAPNNLLVYSNDFTNGNWIKQGGNVTISSTNNPAPDGTNTAALAVYTGTNSLYQSPVFTSSEVRRLFSVWVKGTAGQTIGVWLTSNFGNSTSNYTLDGTWQRISCFITPTSAITTCDVAIRSSGTASSVYVWGAQLEVVTYQTRPSGQYYNNYPTPNTTSAYIGPRYDYNPSTVPATALGLLVEGTRTNLLTYSQTFQTNWVSNGTLLNDTGFSAPDGTLNARKIQADSTVLAQYNLQQGPISASVGQSVTNSVYVKYGSSRWVAIGVYDTTWFLACFDTINGVFGAVDSGITFSSINVGNGWYRISVTRTLISTGFYHSIFLRPSNTTTLNWTANKSEFNYFFGGQAEVGSFATSYIPTLASSIGRATETLTFANNTNRLVDSFFIDEATGDPYSQNTNGSSTSPVSLTAPTFGWSTSLRSYINAYAGNVSNPAWLSLAGMTDANSVNRMFYDSTGALTYAPVNLLAQSQDYTTGSWTRFNVSSPTVYTTAPDGTNTGAKLPSSTTATVVHQCYQINVSLAAGAYIASVYFKKDAYSYGIINFYDGSNNFVYFNLDTGQTGTVPAGFTAGMQSVGGGWYRCWVIKTVSAITGGISIEFSNADNTPSFSAAIGSGVYAWGAQLERVTYQTAPSAYTATGAAYSYGARYDYDPAPVLNYAKYSQDFDNAAWGKGFVTVSANSAAAPDGSNTADKVSGDGVLSGHYFNQAVTLLPNTTYTISVYAKAAELSFGYIFVSGTGAGGYSTFNYLTGTLGSLQGSIVSRNITSAGNGWYRASIVITTGASIGGNFIEFSVSPTDQTGTSTASGGIFFWGVQLELTAPNVTTPSTYYPTTAAPYYGPATPRGLLIEEQRVNILIQSQAFNTSWSNVGYLLFGSGGSIVDAAVAPDGTTTADKIVEDTSTGNHAPYRYGISLSALTYTLSVFVKAAERNWIQLTLYDGSTDTGAYFNVSAGTVGTTDAGITASIQGVGNGWYRCIITKTCAAGSGGPAFYLATGNGGKSYAGNGTSGILLWGAQLEHAGNAGSPASASFVTSYIPTTTASVTRAPDIVQLTGSALTTLQGNASSAAVEVSGVVTTGGSFAQVLSVNTGTALIGQNGSSSTSIYTQNAAATVIPATLGSGTLGVTFRAACSFNSAGMSVVGNNGTVGTGAGAPVTVTASTLGSRGGFYFINNCVRSMAIYNQRLPDATLKQKSTVGSTY